MTSEKDLLEERAQSNNVQIEGLRTALVESKAFGEKIQHESQLVVRNINIWVQEQKFVFIYFYFYMVVWSKTS